VIDASGAMVTGTGELGAAVTVRDPADATIGKRFGLCRHAITEAHG